MDCNDAQELIDNEIAVHESAIRGLRTLRNTHASISKLPVEVLSEIFLLARLPPGISYLERHANRGWLNVAGVCRSSWREITLNAPRMWDTLNTLKLNSLDWAETLVARSKNVPLHVSCTYPHRATPPAVLDLVLSHMARIQDLELILDTSLNVKIQDIIDLCGTRCRLQSLTLIHPHSIPNVDNGGVDRFFAEIQMPHLRVLEVRFFALPPTTFMLPRLIYLRFVSSGTALSRMLSFLRNTPSLQHLEVSDSFEPSDNGTMECPSVELPKLSSLTYTTSDIQGTPVFRFLHYPPSTRVEFLSRTPPSDTATCADDLASVLTCVEKSDAAATIEAISLIAVDDDFFHMQVSGHDGLMLGIYLPVDEGQIRPLLKLPTMLPCSGARKLRIRGFHSVTVAYWATFFTRHPQVRDLTAVEVDANFFRALLRPSKNEPLPFMSVQHLLLSYCVIKKDNALLLKRVLEERTHLAVDVTLKIEDCRVGENTIRELEAYAKVEWDGIERLGLEEGSEDDGDEDSDEDSDDEELTFISTAQ